MGTTCTCIFNTTFHRFRLGDAESPGGSSDEEEAYVPAKKSKSSAKDDSGSSYFHLDTSVVNMIDITLILFI